MAISAVDLRGLVPAAVLPMDSDGNVVESELRSYIKWLQGQGPVALAINVDTGEGGHLSPRERLRVLEVVKEEATVPLVVGLHGPYTAQAVAEAKDLKAAGADGFLVFPIVAYQSKPLDPAIPIDYHKAIASVGVPIVLFQLQPALAGITFDQTALQQLLAIDQVVAIKEASFDAMVMRRTAQAVSESGRHVAVLTGNDNFMLESFMLGSDGALLGFGAMMTDEMVAMIHAWHDGDLDNALRLGARTQKMADVVFAPPVSSYRSRLKHALAMLGVIDEACANVRLPLHSVDEADKRQIRDALVELDLL